MKKYNLNKLFTHENLSRQTFPDQVEVIVRGVSQFHLHHEHLQNLVGEDPAFFLEIQNSTLLVQFLIQFKYFKLKV